MAPVNEATNLAQHQANVRITLEALHRGMLLSNRNNLTQTAKCLGIARSTLIRRLKAMGLYAEVVLARKENRA